MNFDEAAKKWDNPMRISRAKKISEKILSMINNKKIDSALEFGCGTGLIGFNMSEYFDHITLLDTSQGMIDVVNSKKKMLKIENIKAVCSDIKEYNSNKKYDVIFTSMVFHHVIDIDSVLNKFHELLNNDGMLFIVDLDKDNGEFHSNEEDFNGYNGFEHEFLIDKFKNNRFNVISCETFYKDKKIINEKEVEYSLFIIKAINNL